MVKCHGDNMHQPMIAPIRLELQKSNLGDSTGMKLRHGCHQTKVNSYQVKGQVTFQIVQIDLKLNWGSQPEHRVHHDFQVSKSQ